MKKRIFPLLIEKHKQGETILSLDRPFTDLEPAIKRLQRMPPTVVVPTWDNGWCSLSL